MIVANVVPAPRTPVRLVQPQPAWHLFWIGLYGDSIPTCLQYTRVLTFGLNRRCCVHVSLRVLRTCKQASAGTAEACSCVRVRCRSNVCSGDGGGACARSNPRRRRPS